ncbi:MAG: GNAT family N-acetyltransferase [Bacteroidia bacterium]|nr:GNAT family N-acetyltransferase [Bacteroidia bacterium]
MDFFSTKDSATKQVALDLALSVFMEYEAPDYPREGVEEFKRAMNDKEYVGLLSFYVAKEGNDIVGMLATRKEGHHVALLFVEGKWHRRGVGKRLLEYMVRDTKVDSLTVNSAPYAHEFYKKIGFVDVDGEQESNGIRYFPMRFDDCYSAIGEEMQSDRVLLRPWYGFDAKALYKYASDPEVGPRAGWQPHRSIEESKCIIKDVFGNDTTWAIVLKSTNEPIGTIGYMPIYDMNINHGEDEPLVGYWVGKPYWNQGICTEALRLMLDKIRRDGKYKILYCSHYVDNPASGRVMVKCGFEYTGDTVVDSTLCVGEGKEMKVYRLSL